jgi:hypothetical protein
VSAKHHLVVIGCTGIRRCYLDVPLEEATRRFLASEERTALDSSDYVDEFDFDDEFGCYDAWRVS